MKFASVFTLALAAAVAPPQTGPTYVFEVVKSKVMLKRAGNETRVTVNARGEAGDEVRTGWIAHTTLAVPDRASRFEIGSGARAVLGGPAPGILLVFERGRLKAVFDALTGNDERLVATPGAVLAVRGTSYGLDVGDNGSASLVVFSGKVEVRSRVVGVTPLLVEPGHACQFSPSAAPAPIPMPRGMSEPEWDRGAVPGGSPHGPGSTPQEPGQPPASMPGAGPPAPPGGTGSGHHP